MSDGVPWGGGGEGVVVGGYGGTRGSIGLKELREVPPLMSAPAPARFGRRPASLGGAEGRKKVPLKYLTLPALTTVLQALRRSFAQESKTEKKAQAVG